MESRVVGDPDSGLKRRVLAAILHRIFILHGLVWVKTTFACRPCIFHYRNLIFSFVLVLMIITGVNWSWSLYTRGDHQVYELLVETHHFKTKLLFTWWKWSCPDGLGGKRIRNPRWRERVSLRTDIPCMALPRKYPECQLFYWESFFWREGETSEPLRTYRVPDMMCITAIRTLGSG